jgi:hypothetical protein
MSQRRRIAAVVLVFAVVGAPLIVSAIVKSGAFDRTCSALGCTSGIYANVGNVQRSFHRAFTVTFCVNGACHSSPVGRARLVGHEWRGVRLNTSTVYTVDVFIRDHAGRTLMHARNVVKLHKDEPNGHACGPTCFYGSLKLEPERRRLRPYQL